MKSKALLFLFLLFTSYLSIGQSCTNSIPVSISQTHSDSFENSVVNWTNPSVSSLPASLTVAQFMLQQGTPQAGSNLPSVASNGNNYVFIRNATSSPNFSGELVSSCFDLTNTIYPTLTYDTYKLNNDGIEAVYVSTDMGNTWTIIPYVSQNINAAIPNQWTSRQVDLMFYSGATNLKIRIVGLNETDIVAFDNIKFEDKRICPPAGTPCDDGNSATQNDLTDGSCGCSGTRSGITNTILNTEDFEVNGSYTWSTTFQAYQLYGHLSPQGKGHTRIRNTGSSIQTTGTLDLTNYQDVTVSFSYFPVAVDSNGSFSLLISNDGGSTYTVAETWTDGVDFHGYSGNYPSFLPNSYDLSHTGTVSSANAVITGPFSSNTKFKIKNNSTVFVEVLVDDIRIQGGQINCPAAGTPCDDNDPTTQNDVEDGNCGCAGTPIPICTTTLIDDNDFETGWTIWNDGGRDSGRRRNSNYSNSGLRSVLIRDNTNSSRITTDALDLTSYTDVTIDFTYITVGFNNANEDFFLEVSSDNGTTYAIFEEWNFGDEFQNNTREFDAVSIAGPFSANMKFRFRCDASTDANQVYLDDIIITGCLQTCPVAGTPCDDNDPTTQNDVEDGNCGCSGTPIPSCTDNIVFTEGFENGIGTWTLSAAGFSRIIDPSNNGGGFFYTPGSGLAHLYLRNSGAAIKSQSFDLSNYQDVEISFMYLTRSLAIGDKFEVWISDNAAPFVLLEEYTFGIEISGNEVIGTATAQLQGPFSSNVKFRIVNNNGGSVEIDDIIIEGCENNSVANRNSIMSLNAVVNKNEENAIRIFPNPTSDVLNIAINNPDFEDGVVVIKNYLGKTIFKREVDRNKEFWSYKYDASNLQSGAYFITLTLDSSKIIKRFIVK